MKRTALIVPVLVIAVLAARGFPGRRRTYTHQEGYFEHYEGTSTCLQCHEDEATSFFHSQRSHGRARRRNSSMPKAAGSGN